MAKTTFNVIMDEILKIKFETWCNYFGIDMSTAINIFARTVVQEQKMPFEISTTDLFGPAYATKMFNAARKQALENGVANMTIEEIDEEIFRTRKGIGE